MFNFQKLMLMSAAQAIASERFLAAMGPMIADEQKMNRVLEYIESIQVQPLYPQTVCLCMKRWINYVKRHALFIRHDSAY